MLFNFYIVDFKMRVILWENVCLIHHIFCVSHVNEDLDQRQIWMKSNENPTATNLVSFSPSIRYCFPITRRLACPNYQPHRKLQSCWHFASQTHLVQQNHNYFQTFCSNTVVFLGFHFSLCILIMHAHEKTIIITSTFIAGWDDFISRSSHFRIQFKFAYSNERTIFEMNTTCYCHSNVLILYE